MNTLFMTSERQSWGEYYGYPKCCIRAFHKMLVEDIKITEISLERRTAAKEGFVPCERCAKKILLGNTEIWKYIETHRQCPTPFKHAF